MWPFKTKEQRKQKRIRALQLEIVELEEIVESWTAILKQNALNTFRFEWIVARKGRLARLRRMLELETSQDG